MPWRRSRYRPDWTTLGADAYRQNVPVNDGPRARRAYSAWCAGYYRAQVDDDERARTEADGREWHEMTLRMAPLLKDMPRVASMWRAVELRTEADGHDDDTMRMRLHALADTYERHAVTLHDDDTMTPWSPAGPPRPRPRVTPREADPDPPTADPPRIDIPPVDM